MKFRTRQMIGDKIWCGVNILSENLSLIFCPSTGLGLLSQLDSSILEVSRTVVFSIRITSFPRIHIFKDKS